MFFRSISLMLIAGLISVCAEASTTLQDAEVALEKAAYYFRETVSTNGGYLWTYSQDLKERAGEGKATETQIWIQQPGTPSVGFAYLRAYEATGDEVYLEAARAAADALVWGQLESGGWDYKIDFDPKGSQRWYYRRNRGEVEQGKRRNYSVFDDNNTQSALRFIMAVQKTTGDEKYLSAVKYGLDLMLKSQFDNGAWPQVYPLPSKGYSRWYTFNDNAINDCIKVMLDAYHIYGNQEYLESAMLAGDFIIASQIPEPQAGWAQQYDHDMKPAPARWFEPAAVCGAVTARNMRTLIDLYLETGREKYLEPMPAAIEWLEKSKMEDGKWARFYELGTNKPIYVNMNREVVYEFVNIRSGYSWMGDYGVTSAIALYNKIKSMGREKYLAERDAPQTNESRRRRLASLEPRVRDVIADLDEQGRWVTGGNISCSTFIRNARLLSDYISLSRSISREGADMVIGKKTYAYKTVGECEIQADVYRLPGNAVRPVILWIHGGALIMGHRSNINSEQLRMYLNAGYTVVSIDYRLAPETKIDGIIQDVQDACKWIREKGPELFNIDPDRMAVIGHSAGGYLTLMTGFCIEPRPNALVAFYGYGDIAGAWYSRPDPFYSRQQPISEQEAYESVGTEVISGDTGQSNRWRFYLYCRQQGLWPREVTGHDPDEEPDAFNPFCPVRNVTAEYAPTIMLHGDADTDVPYGQSVMMADELKRIGVEHELTTISDGGHGFDGAGAENPVVASAFEKVLAFLKQHTQQ